MLDNAIFLFVNIKLIIIFNISLLSVNLYIVVTFSNLSNELITSKYILLINIPYYLSFDRILIL